MKLNPTRLDSLKSCRSMLENLPSRPFGPILESFEEKDVGASLSVTKTGSSCCKNNVSHTANAATEQCYQNWTFPY